MSRGNQVVQVKTKEKDGYSAVQLGYDEKKEKRVHQAGSGISRKHGVHAQVPSARVPPRGGEAARHGHHARRGTVRGGAVRGRDRHHQGPRFPGVVKRYRFRGQPATHGSMMHRRTGSIGCRLTPGRVWKNQKMPGHMGVDRRTDAESRSRRRAARKTAWS